jgi:NADPH:quinone reductase-like Zn-dependent oxidoreductase
MQAIRIHPPTDPSSSPYSPTNPAPHSSLTLDNHIPVPTPTQPGEVLIRNKASTVNRDQLRWPVTYSGLSGSTGYPILGRDLAGTVVSVHGPSHFKPRDDVYGMTVAERASTWAEYALALSSEVALKP